ncbi:MAG: hypothetical protein KY454_00545 [Actinobacteria bacterium]|nr:hypothetical protein [Actinomycetota bacterium]MBW3649510.1 hypothetical protein [Actinomycetota bacterium]
MGEAGRDDGGDELPEELDVSAYVGPYSFPDNRRRRFPGLLYLLVGAGLVALFVVRGDGVLVNEGLLVAGLGLLAVGGYHWLAAYPLRVDETDALAAAGRTVGFAVGHASAQLGWRGLRSRPTWRLLLYSAEDPPVSRGLVLVDAVDAGVVAHFVEENPEDWSEFTPEQRKTTG